MIKSVLIFLPATLMPRLAAFVLSIIGANILPISEFGYFALVMVIGEASEMVAVGWSRVLLIRYGSTDRGLDQGVLHKMAAASGIGLGVALCLAISLSYVLAPERFWEMALSTVAYVVSFNVLRLGLTTLQISGRSVLYSSLESLRAPVYVIGAALIMLTTGVFSFASVVASTFVFVIGAIALVAGWRSAQETNQTAIDRQTILRTGLPIFLTAICTYFIVSLDKFALASSFSKELIASYAIAFALGRQGFDVLANAINVYAFPQLVRDFKTNGASGASVQAHNALALILATTIPAAGVLIGSRDFIASLILPSAYHEAIHVALPYVAFGAICMNLKNFCFDNIFHIFEKNYYQLPTLALGAAASIVFAIWLPFEDQLISASAIYVSGALVSFVASVCVSRRFLQPQTPLILGAIVCLWSAIGYMGATYVQSLSEHPTISAIYIVILGIALLGGGLIFYKKFELQSINGGTAT